MKPASHLWKTTIMALLLVGLQGIALGQAVVAASALG